uniref:Uncharacterized protein n=1 Tax=Zea mays TaxID=4577 RepID=A0A804M0A1_MAIZE
MLIALIWQYDFSPFTVLIIAILNDGTIMTISKDRVKPSPLPDSWKLKEIFVTGIDKFGVRSIRDSEHKMMSALYLQVSIVSQALIFVTRSRSWSFVERPGLLLVTAFLLAQLVATFLAVYANWGFARIKGIGWAGVVWLYSIVFYFPLDLIKFFIRFVLSGRAWDNLLENKDYGRGEREAQWATAQRTLHGLQPPEASSNTLFNDKSSYRELSEIAEQAKRRAEIARLRELNTLKGHVESVVKLKGLDIDTIQHNYTIKAKIISEIHSEAEKNLGLRPRAASVIRNGRSSPGGPLSPGGGFPMNRSGTGGMMSGMPGSRKMPGMPGLDSR